MDPNETPLINDIRDAIDTSGGTTTDTSGQVTNIDAFLEALGDN